MLNAEHTWLPCNIYLPIATGGHSISHAFWTPLHFIVLIGVIWLSELIYWISIFWLARDHSHIFRGEALFRHNLVLNMDWSCMAKQGPVGYWTVHLIFWNWEQKWYLLNLIIFENVLQCQLTGSWGGCGEGATSQFLDIDQPHSPWWIAGQLD